MRPYVSDFNRFEVRAQNVQKGKHLLNQLKIGSWENASVRNMNLNVLAYWIHFDLTQAEDDAYKNIGDLGNEITLSKGKLRRA